MVVDEAAMLDTFMAAKLTDAVVGKGGKLVTVGDNAQLQAIGPGGAFQAVVDRIGESHKKLTTITRQNREVDRKGVMDFSKGEAEVALRSYAERGLVYVGAHHAGAVKRLIQDWEAHGGAKEAKDHLIITGKRDLTEKLNAAAQEKARRAGALGDRNVFVKGKTIFERDRVLFTYTGQGFSNGTLGTVEQVDRLGNRMMVRLDNGKHVHVDLHRYDHIELGYAITTHRGQGCTVQKNAYVYVGGRMQDLHLSYVQASRAKEDTRFYTTRLEAGDKLSRLAKAMSQSREKTFAHDFKDEPNRPEQGRSVSISSSPSTGRAAKILRPSGNDV
jgi:ATP-dependent exoDNAse (exonuclease V) alpha subunit